MKTRTPLVDRAYVGNLALLVLALNQSTSAVQRVRPLSEALQLLDRATPGGSQGCPTRCGGLVFYGFTT
jgi:hypothetical protein